MTIEDLIKEAVRAVYPNSAKAHQLACMDKIEAVLKAIAARPDLRAEIETATRLESPQPSLL